MGKGMLPSSWPSTSPHRSRFEYEKPMPPPPKAGTRVSVSLATREDAAAMVATMNAAQAEQIISLSEMSLSECVEHSLLRSQSAWSGRVDGELVAMWGVSEIADGVGYPWMFSTESLRGVPKLTLGIAHRVIEEMLALYPRLYGSVGKQFQASVRFARHLGFTLAESSHDPAFYTIDLVRRP